MHTVPGRLFVVSAASGTGKTTLVNWLVNTVPQVQLSVSHTTRAPRPGEQNGVHYHFVPVAEFESMLMRAAFFEHALVHGNYYGTSQEFVEKTLQRGIDVILEIDWQGAQQIRRLKPECLSIFILPPSRDALESRLRGRGQDSEDVIQKRLKAARDEMSHCLEYDYLVVNDQLDVAKEELKSIFLAERCTVSVQTEKHAEQLQALLNK